MLPDFIFTDSSAWREPFILQGIIVALAQKKLIITDQAEIY
jgi:hypothetical protein